MPEFKEDNQKGVIHVLLLIIAFAAIGFFIFKSGSLKNTVSKFVSGIHPPLTSATTPTDTSYNMNVLVLKYFPLTSDGQNIDISITGDVSDSYSVIKQRTVDITNNLVADIPKATKYLGYKDSTAQNSLNYSVVDTKEYTTAVPFDPTTRRPLYTQILNGNNICDYVDNKGIQEVWMWAYQGPTYPGSVYPYLNISESKMSGPFGDISNSYRGNDMPLCKHTYRLYTFNYGRGTGEAIHSWGHQIEAEISAVDNHLFRDLWQGPNYPQTLSVTGRCGSVHNPPNARSEYDWANSTPQNSDCLDWNPDSVGSLTQISCSNWGCQEQGDQNNPQINYIIWNLQNLPGRNNTKTYQGNKLRNLWDVHGDFDNVMANSRSLTLVQPSSSSIPQVNITDSFNRVDSSSLGTTATGQVWTNLVNGSFGISGNQAYSVSGCPAPGYTVVDGGVSDAILQVSLPVNAQDLRIPFRVVDANNMYFLEHKGGDFYEIDKISNGVQSAIGQTPGGIAKNSDVIKITLNGQLINVYVNGVLQAWANDSEIKGTKFGIGNWCNGSLRFDDFSISSLPVSSPSPSLAPAVSASPSNSPTPIPTSTPIPTKTPSPTNTPVPSIIPLSYLLEAENMSLPRKDAIFSDTTATGQKAVVLYSNSIINGSLATNFFTSQIIVRAEGDQCNGSPRMEVKVDGKSILTSSVPATVWNDYTTSLNLSPATHKISISFNNDYFRKNFCDRNLKIDSIILK